MDILYDIYVDDVRVCDRLSPSEMWEKLEALKEECEGANIFVKRVR